MWFNSLEMSGKSRYRTLLNGVSKAFPIVIGYIPIGIAYGVLARKMGLSEFNTMIMSLIVFAGSAQFIAVGLFATGAASLTVILTTFIVNLRHMLMSAALSPFLKKWNRGELALFAFEITDESFAVHNTRYSSGDLSKPESFIINVTAQCAWIFGSFIGVVASDLITDVTKLGLDYALPAMFIGLLVLQFRNKKQIIVAVGAGFLSVGLLMIGLNQWNVIFATLIGATFGLLLEKWIKS